MWVVGKKLVAGHKRRVGAGVAVLRGREVLLIRRSDNGLWDIPGGGAQRGEAPETAAQRELREETRLTAAKFTPLGVFPHQHTYPDGNVVDWDTHVFTAQFVDGTPEAQDDAAEVRWWPLAALPDRISAATQAYFEALRAAP
nr:NUDIX domain-containing protein [Deinococcus arboris]